MWAAFVLYLVVQKFTLTNEAAFAMIDGVVKFERKDKKRKQVSVYPKEVLALMKEYGISARLTFSNSLLRTEHLSDKKYRTGRECYMLQMWRKSCNMQCLHQSEYKTVL